MEKYYFKLVCVDEMNPFCYEVLEDVNIGDLENVHLFVKKHLEKYLHKNVKWMLFSIEK